MKLPKGFGGQGFGAQLAKAQQAMARAQDLETELANDRIAIDKGPVKAIVAGTGQLVKLSLDKSVVDPEDIEALEDLIVSAVRDGFDKATELRAAKVEAITRDSGLNLPF
ncbi:MAG TPA: YbaB/EbfC family nucleoid-associated protein [Fimbriimonadaceae bacterium]|nr:YbaB/EbfC family nucleoid-associated protein [Fimbriimonadaceae bacterium]